MARLISLLILLTLVAGCGNDTPSAPTGSGVDLTGIWFSSAEFGEHTMLLYENGRWIDLSVYLVPAIDFDPYTIDPVVMAESEYDGGRFEITNGQIAFTYWGDGHTETLPLATEGLNTPSHDDDLLIIGNRPYLFSDTLSGTVVDPVPLSNVSIVVSGGERAYTLHVFSTRASHIDSDHFGFVPVVLSFKSTGGSELEITVADLSLITLNQPLAIDGSALGIRASLDDWESLWWAGGEVPEGTITFARLEDSRPGYAVASGRIDGLRLWDYDVQGSSVVVNAVFQNVELAIE